MLNLRTELHMRMVMPTVVAHSAQEPFMTMARFETGSNGNPHWHLFAMGKAGPRVQRVRGDVGGEGDELPDTEGLDEQCVRLLLEGGRAPGVGSARGLPEEELRGLVHEALRSRDSVGGVEVMGAAGGGEGEGDECEAEGGSDAEDAAAAYVARVSRVLDGLVARGVLEVCLGTAEEGRRFRLLVSKEAAAAGPAPKRPMGAAAEGGRWWHDSGSTC